MTRTEQERLVERYLNSEMSSADEQEFFIQVAVDSNLRQTLKAYRIVESALRKHRDAALSQHAESRSRIISTLQTASMASAGLSGVTPAGVAPIPSLQSKTRLGSAMFKWVFLAVIAVGLTFGGIMMTSDMNTASGGHTPSSNVPNRMNGTAGAPQAPAAEATSPAVLQQESAASQPQIARDRETIIPSSSNEKRAVTRTQPRKITREASVQTTTPDGPAVSETTPATREPAASTDAAVHSSEPTLQRSSRDTLNMRMQMVPPRPR